MRRRCVRRTPPSGVFRHEAPVNVRVFLHEFVYTIPQSALYKIDKCLFAGG